MEISEHPRYITRIVSIPGRHAVIIDVQTSEIVREFSAHVTEREASEIATQWNIEAADAAGK